MIARAHEIEAWLIQRLAERLDISTESIDPCEPFASHGLTSREAVVLSGEMEEWLERTLSPTLVWDHPTIRELARFLSGDAAPSATTPPAAASGPDAADHIAIVGLGCRFPGAPDPDAFWSLLRSGGDAIREVPADRWDVAAFYDPDPATPGTTTTRFGGFLPGIDQFDPSFFCISPREASHMDPQQRLLLEVAWEALENAGIAPQSLYGTATGVFVGISTNDYAGLQLSDPARVGAHDGTGSAHSIAANRLSYLLDLRGPSMAVDTACSSSLVAVHLACQSLRTGECRVALAAGVNVVLTPQLTIVFSKAGMMAADGRCKTFDATADGYVRGEGCGVVVLKRLADALADGDQVLAIVRGSAVNQDGLSNGLTAPNGLAQEAVIRAALARAGISPHDVSHVEAHGTGTPLGDPIEVGALGAVLMPERPPGRPCTLASVKTNIGHLEAAAGIAGLIKTVLALVHREIARAARGARGIVHLQALDARISEDLEHGNARAVARAQSLSCGSALQLTRALLAAEAACRTWFVTRGSQPVLPTDAIELGQAPLWGFGRALALEHPELWGGLVDVDDQPPGALAVALAGELLGAGDEDQVAYRAARRYAARLERRPVLPTRSWSLRADATYLVTGGLGGIGLALSRWLVERGARHLVLTGRTAGAPTGAQRGCIAELERRGATVTLVQVDAGDEPSMEALLDDLRRAPAPLRGVFHAAGVSAPRIIAELDASGLAAVLAPKVTGAWILHRLTRDLELDHFVCFSSISSILGSRRLAAYAAGNAFLDALAHHRAALGLPALCVNWGPWAEVGMTPVAEQAALDRSGMHALPTREALAVLDHLMGGGTPQITAANIDWSALVPALEARARRPLLDAVRSHDAAAAVARPGLLDRLEAAAPAARAALVVDWLRGEVASVLGRDTPAAIDVEQGLFEMGLDSLMAVELKRRLERATGLTLARTVAFEYPSVEALARHLCTVCACARPSASPIAPAALGSTTTTLTTLTTTRSEREAEALLIDELHSLEQENRI